MAKNWLKSEKVSTHSRTKAAAIEVDKKKRAEMAFQHTAARRRLPLFVDKKNSIKGVSTHSRTKAAAIAYFLISQFMI